MLLEFDSNLLKSNSNLLKFDFILGVQSACGVQSNIDYF